MWREGCLLWVVRRLLGEPGFVVGRRASLSGCRPCFTVLVTDSAIHPATVTWALSITVALALTVTTAELPEATVSIGNPVTPPRPRPALGR